MTGKSTETTSEQEQDTTTHGIFTKIGKQTDRLVGSVRNGAKKAKENHDLKKRVDRLERMMRELGFDLDNE